MFVDVDKKLFTFLVVVDDASDRASSDVAAIVDVAYVADVVNGTYVAYVDDDPFHI